ncbi:hypothetical protein [Paracoccus sp. 228]|uniref:hypothetical protein n=1 Tax=Paracoccus sp. 228 TaxID=1192054 RepID=UPI000B3047AC|nr:hypothetical protein [Paracoccus sp. 228]
MNDGETRARKSRVQDYVYRFVQYGERRDFAGVIMWQGLVVLRWMQAGTTV